MVFILSRSGEAAAGAGEREGHLVVESADAGADTAPDSPQTGRESARLERWWLEVTGVPMNVMRRNER